MKQVSLITALLLALMCAACAASLCENGTPFTNAPTMIANVTTAPTTIANTTVAVTTATPTTLPATTVSNTTNAPPATNATAAPNTTVAANTTQAPATNATAAPNTTSPPATNATAAPNTTVANTTYAAATNATQANVTRAPNATNATVQARHFFALQVNATNATAANATNATLAANTTNAPNATTYAPNTTVAAATNATAAPNTTVVNATTTNAPNTTVAPTNATAAPTNATAAPTTNAPNTTVATTAAPTATNATVAATPAPTTRAPTTTTAAPLTTPTLSMECAACKPGFYGSYCNRTCRCGNNGTCFEGVNGNGSCTSCGNGSFFGPSCANCTCQQGVCDNGVSGNGTCKGACNANFSGANCDTCVPGNYGVNCSMKCNCSTGDICAEGVRGNGTCTQVKQVINTIQIRTATRFNASSFTSVAAKEGSVDSAEVFLNCTGNCSSTSTGSAGATVFFTIENATIRHAALDTILPLIAQSVNISQVNAFSPFNITFAAGLAENMTIPAKPNATAGPNVTSLFTSLSPFIDASLRVNASNSTFSLDNFTADFIMHVVNLSNATVVLVQANVSSRNGTTVNVRVHVALNNSAANTTVLGTYASRMRSVRAFNDVWRVQTSVVVVPTAAPLPTEAPIQFLVLTVDATVETFNKTTFSAGVAEALSLQPANVDIVSVVAASVRVTMRLVGLANQSVTQDAYKSLVQKLSEPDSALAASLGVLSVNTVTNQTLPPSPAGEDDDSDGLGVGAIIGIVIGTVAAAGIGAAGIMYVMKAAVKEEVAEVLESANEEARKAKRIAANIGMEGDEADEELAARSAQLASGIPMPGVRLPGTTELVRSAVDASGIALDMPGEVEGEAKKKKKSKWTEESGETYEDYKARRKAEKKAKKERKEAGGAAEGDSGEEEGDQ